MTTNFIASNDLACPAIDKIYRVKSESDMKINCSKPLSKTLFVIKCMHWAWIFLCFVFWILLLLGNVLVNGLDYNDGNLRKLYEFLFEWGDYLGEYFQALMFVSPLALLIIFIILSIVRRKIQLLEFLVISTLWVIVLVALSFFPRS